MPTPSSDRPAVQDEPRPGDNAASSSAPNLSLDVDKNAQSKRERIPTGYTISDPASVEEDGRSFQYYRYGAYPIPNDGGEQDRLDLQHAIWCMLLDDKLVLAPVGEPAQVLDVATGTGMWAFEFAEQHPNSNVIGTDLSMIQPSRPAIKNVSFVREDSQETWVWSHKFDLVHARNIATAFTNIRRVIQRSFDGLNEGGWLELQDPVIDLRSHNNTAEGTSIKRLMDTMDYGFRTMGINIRKGIYYKQWLQDAGFVNVVEHWLPLPINTWPNNPEFKQIGRWNRVNATEGFPALSAKTLPAAGLSKAEHKDLVAEAIRDLGNTGIHGYWPTCVVYGRKPITSNSGANQKAP